MEHKSTKNPRQAQHTNTAARDEKGAEDFNT